MQFSINMYPYMSKPRSSSSVDIPLEVIQDLLTPSEVRMLKNRYFIIELLEEGLPIRSIAEKAKVGTDTVMRVSKMLEGNPKIRKSLNTPKKVSGSKWIFGQIGSKE